MLNPQLQSVSHVDYKILNPQLQSVSHADYNILNPQLQSVSKFEEAIVYKHGLDKGFHYPPFFLNLFLFLFFLLIILLAINYGFFSVKYSSW